MAQRQHHLHESGNPGRGLEMPDVALHRPEPQPRAVGPRLTEHRPQRVHLNRIAERRPAAVALEYPICSGSTPARASAARSRASCDRTFGVVSPVERPSWFIAEPRTTAQTSSPSRRASDSRFKTTNPQPSPRTNPFAAALEHPAPPVG